MGALGIREISKNYGAVSVLRDICLDVAAGEFLTLLGPSGCGKSTLLRIIAGLERQDAGTVSLGGRVVDGLRPKARDVAMVFQSYALYPHMTVAQNMALPLKMRRLSPWQRLPLVGRVLPGTSAAVAGIDAEVVRIASALGIDHLLARKPAQLSGGQRQRVAVGRAMVRHPAVFLMDEPLSNLDAKLRVQMRSEIKELHRRLGVTFIYVTHDQAEAMTLSDRVAVMLDGEVLQVAPPRQIYDDPADRRVAEFVGSPKINMLDVRVRERGVLDLAGSTLFVDVDCAAGTALVLGIRPEALQLAERAGPGTLSGVVRLSEHLGSDIFIHLDVPGSSEPLVARLPAERAPHVETGQLVHLGLRAERALPFAQDGRRLRTQATVMPLREYAR